MHLVLEENKKIINYLFAESVFQLTSNINETSFLKSRVNATLYIHEEKLSFDEIITLRNKLIESNIKLLKVISDSKEVIIAANSLKIVGIYSNNKFDELFPKVSSTKSSIDITHIGMVRSGDLISSNGNLIIIGDVNPGAKISAKKNIYVWGKLCGVAFAGKNGDNDSTISSLYLNALQLRINKTVAIGPKEKPSNNYPEIAIIDKGKIIIKPLLVNT
tara:strand:- start:3657 stop:4310 length:654 start_codon:yes stop_codon:yes gene_type:complete